MNKFGFRMLAFQSFNHVILCGTVYDPLYTMSIVQTTLRGRGSMK